MPGPTTEVLNDDIKEIRADVRANRDEMHDGFDKLTSAIHELAVGQTEIKTELRVSLSVARWGAVLLVGTVITAGSTAIWWASNINAQVRNLAERFDRVEGVKLPRPEPRP